MYGLICVRQDWLLWQYLLLYLVGIIKNLSGKTYEDLPMFQDSANVTTLKLATMKKTMRLCVINYASWKQMK